MPGTRKSLHHENVAAGQPRWAIGRKELLVLLLSAVVFLNSTAGDLVFDDLPAIKDNPDVRLPLSWRNIFSHDFWGNPLSDPTSHKSYRPITVLSFRLNYVVHGMQPHGYHVVNILLHAAVTLLFMWLCQRVVRKKIACMAALLFAVHPIHTEAVSSVVGRAEPLSAVFYCLALLIYSWGHPAPSQSLSTKASQSLSTKASSRQYAPVSAPALLATCVMATLSMLCKEQGITCLAVCCAYDVVIVCQLDVTTSVRYITSIRKSKTPKWLKSCVFRCMFLSVVTASLLVGRVWLIAGGGATSFTQSDNPTLFEPSVMTRTLTYSYLPAFCTWLLLCPVWLCFDWSMDSIPRLHSIHDPRVLPTVLLFTLVLALVVYAFFPCASELPSSIDDNTRTDSSITSPPELKSITSPAELKCRRATAMAVTLMLVPYLPASNLFFPVGFVVAERVLYLPSIGFCLLVAIGFGKILSFFCVSQEAEFGNGVSDGACGTDGPGNEDRSVQAQVQYSRGSGVVRRVGYGALVLLLLSMSCRTWCRNNDWHSMSSLCTAGVKVNPANAKIHFSIGNELAQQGQRVCETHFREAIRLRPNYTAAWINMGLVILNMNRPEEAEAAYQKALEINSRSGNAHTNYGHLCRLQSRWTEALYHYKKALEQQEGNPTLLHNAGLCCKEMKNATCAVEFWKACVKRYPTYTDSWFEMGYILSRDSKQKTKDVGKELPWSKGKRAKHAEEALRSGLNYQPFTVDAWLVLTQLFLGNGDVDNAEISARTGLSHSPQTSSLRYWLGKVMETRQRLSEATQHFLAALQLDPHSTLARSALSQISAKETRA